MDSGEGKVSDKEVREGHMETGDNWLNPEYILRFLWR